MKQTPATAQISPLHAQAAGCRIIERNAYGKIRCLGKMDSEATAKYTAMMINNHTRLVKALRDAAAGLAVLADDSGFPSRAENVRDQVKEIRNLLTSLEQA